MNNIKNNQFLVLGRAGLDLYADPPGTRTEEALAFSSAIGGSAANIAVAITKLGGQASLISCVSDDAVGRYILNQLNLMALRVITCILLQVKRGAVWLWWKPGLRIVSP